MSTHPTPEELADHWEGLLREDEARALDGHLEGCTACQAVHADLEELQALLAADRPGPMPPDVAVRLDAALAAAAAEAPTPAVIMQLPGVIPKLDRAYASAVRRRRYVRLASVAAGLVLVVGGSVLGSQVLREQTRSGIETASGGAAEAPALESGQPMAGAAGPPAASSSGRSYTQAGFAGQVAALLRSAYAADSLTAPQRESGALATDQNKAAMACAARLATQTGQSGVSPVAVDMGLWNGKPALVVVLPSPGVPTDVHAYVVARDCAAQPSGQVVPLHDQVVPRP